VLLQQPFAGAKPPADQPKRRRGWDSHVAHRQLVVKARQGRNRIGLYFAGDCIARRWGAIDFPAFLAHWEKAFFGWNAANFAWGADSIKHQLWRLMNGELDGVHPRVIVLMLGTNNIGNLRHTDEDAVVADIVSGFKALVNVCFEKAPATNLIITGIAPRNDGPEGPLATIPTIRKTNLALAALANGKGIRFLDISDKLADKRGVLYPGMSDDGLHFTLQSYEIWLQALRPLLFEVLGPPASEDHAPPPTGDPAAKRSRLGRLAVALLDKTIDLYSPDRTEV
jgi:lysophospholipase L1-like esterase